MTGNREINASTEFCGVIGNPVSHSLSPAIHNAAFKRVGVNCVYLAWQVELIEEAIKGLRALGNFRGASVTIPHKVSAMQFVDQIEPTAKAIGAINTIVAENGKLTGYNTDAAGALRALREGGVELAGQHIVIVGSGGAGRAIAFGLAFEAGLKRLTLFGVDDAERSTLANDVRLIAKCEVDDYHLDETNLGHTLPSARVLIHCTPVGMFPNVGATCVSPSLLHDGLIVMDIVYNPRETALLKDAKRRGCQVIPGLEMFLHQAAAQFELWTNRPAPADIMRAVLESRFQ
jgi:shikimate dehydrogenase